MKIGFYTDIHFTNIFPKRRKDNFSESLLKKVEEIYKVASDNDVELMILGGDLFHKLKVYSFDIIVNYLKILWKYNIKTYFVVGQHDLYGYNKESYKESTLYFTSYLSRGLLKPISGIIELGGINLYACHVYNDFEEKIKTKVKDKNKFNILVVHKLLDDSIGMFDTILTKSIGKSEYDLVLSGDLHKGYKLHQVENTSYYNPGSIARIKYNDINKDRDIKFGIFDIRDKNFDFIEYKLKCVQPIEEVFDIEKNELISMERDDNILINTEQFIDKFEQFEKESIDIFRLIELVGKSEKIDNKLLEFIKEFREQ